MNGYNFTERLRKVLALAREEAHALNHEYVGTEHLLLGLINEGEGVAAGALQNLNIDFDKIRAEVGSIVLRGKSSEPKAIDLPYTSRSKKVLELSMEEARDLKHNYVGTEHMMLGLIREERGVAAQLLVAAGVTLQSARNEVLRLLGAQPSHDGHPSGWTAVLVSPMDRVIDSAPPAGVTIELRFKNGSHIQRAFADVADALAFLEAHKTPFPKG